MWLIHHKAVGQVASVLWLSLNAALPAKDEDKKAPKLEYRADAMQVLTQPNRALLRDNVVVRRGNLWVCCQSFLGQADSDWDWQRFTCTVDVRAMRGDETMWADKAELIVETHDLILTGHPRLHRGKSVLEGERIIVDIHRDRARIVKPKGLIETVSSASVAPIPPDSEGDLPNVCPVPPPPGS